MIIIWIFIIVWIVGIFVLISIGHPKSDIDIITCFLWPIGIFIRFSDWIYKKYWSRKAFVRSKK